ncbi:MAG: hypothetical protein ACJASY_001900 [Halioglobus sp.]|jgi:hypothetical protein
MVARVIPLQNCTQQVPLTNGSSIRDGLAVLYAEENNRDSLSSAIQRRETYATSGPRISVRFFGGWEVPADLRTWLYFLITIILIRYCK